MSIPVRNVYYLLCYAWNVLEEGRLVDVETIRPKNVVDLLAAVLSRGVEHLLRRGLDRGYLENSERLRTIRGRIEHGPTIRSGLHRQGQVHCAFDELSYNVLHNQILKTTITALITVPELDPELRRRLVTLRRRLGAIDEVPLVPPPFGRVQLHRNTAFYRFLLHVCELAASCLIPDDDTGTRRFRDFLRDDRKMASLFEQFVRNFYAREQAVFSVKSERLKWEACPVDGGRPDDLNYLPQMLTDISLRSPDRTLVIDTKYYHRALTSRYGGQLKVRSNNLYQLHAYLSTLETRDGPDGSAEGLLLYPDCSGAVDLAFEIQGHRVRVKTLCLDQDWQHIHRDLLGILEEA